MDPSSIIAQADKDTTPVASAKMGSNGSANEKTQKGNMKKHLAILRDRLFCCVRPTVPPSSEQISARAAQKTNKRAPIYNPTGKNSSGNVSVLRRNPYRADGGVSDNSESVNGGRSDVPLLANENGNDFVTTESIVLSESPNDGSTGNRQQGRGVLYEVHLSTTISSTSSGRHSSPAQVATPANNGEISFANENRNRPSSSYSSGATNGQPTSSTPLGVSAANNGNNASRSPQVFSPPISGVITSAAPNAPGRRVVTYQQSECAITINSAGQTTAGATSTSFSLLLGEPLHEDRHKPCLIIDLDETLVHSSFKPIPNADFIVPVEIDGTIYQVYVQKRPHVDEFLQRVGQMFECVLFTASLAKYADPVADLLDKWGVFRARLFREACVFYRGNYVKDLGQLGRELDAVAIIDNSPASYLLHPENAIPVTSWFDDPSDIQLLELLPVLERLASNLAPGVRQSGARELLRELIGPVPQVSPLAPPTPNSNSVVTSAVNPNTQQQQPQPQQQQQQQQRQQQDSGIVSTSTTVTMNSSSSSSNSASSSSASPPASPFSPQPVQLVVVGPNASTIHHITPSASSQSRNAQLRTSRFNVH